MHQGTPRKFDRLAESKLASALNSAVPITLVTFQSLYKSVQAITTSLLFIDFHKTFDNVNRVCSYYNFANNSKICTILYSDFGLL